MSRHQTRSSVRSNYSCIHGLLRRSVDQMAIFVVNVRFPFSFTLAYDGTSCARASLHYYAVHDAQCTRFFPSLILPIRWLANAKKLPFVLLLLPKSCENISTEKIEKLKGNRNGKMRQFGFFPLFLRVCMCVCAPSMVYVVHVASLCWPGKRSHAAKL